MELAIVISIGKWGGIYTYRGFGRRLCLGWIAITVFPVDGDDILEAAAKWCDEQKETSIDSRK